MPRLPDSLRAWGSPAFEAILHSEIAALPADSLPLDALTSQGGHVGATGMTTRLLEAEVLDHCIRARLGVFFTEWVGGCSCGDDPMPVQGYGELDLIIDRRDGSARFLPRAD